MKNRKKKINKNETTLELYKRHNRNALLNKEKKPIFAWRVEKFQKNEYDMTFFFLFSPKFQMLGLIFTDSQNTEQRKLLRSEVFSRFDWRKRNVKIYCLE